MLDIKFVSIVYMCSVLKPNEISKLLHIRSSIQMSMKLDDRSNSVISACRDDKLQGIKISDASHGLMHKRIRLLSTYDWIKSKEQLNMNQLIN